jgi:phosphatidylinositol-3-phosphatase
VIVSRCAALLLATGALLALLAACAPSTSAAPTMTPRSTVSSSAATPRVVAATTTPVAVAASTPATGEAAAPTPTRIASPTRVTSSSAVPGFSHVYLIVLENREYSQVIGSADAPYLNSLAQKYGLATAYNAVTHPSQPNYVALVAGSPLGVTDDANHEVSGPNLFDQIEAAGKTWSVFAENVPLNCYTVATAADGEDGPGTYARKHEPAISFPSIQTNSSRCARITDFTHFSPSAADFELIVPNLCHDMHDCSIQAGDSFMRGFVPKILQSAAWQRGGVLFITWDEGTSGEGGGGRVPLLVISNQLVSSGFQSATPHSHYSLLHTVENAWGLGCLQNTCAANDLREFFR